jgi:hypothetical protein
MEGGIEKQSISKNYLRLQRNSNKNTESNLIKQKIK